MIGILLQIAHLINLISRDIRKVKEGGMSSIFEMKGGEVSKEIVAMVAKISSGLRMVIR